MSLLNQNEKTLLNSERIDAPVLAALASALIDLGAPASLASLDKASRDGFELQTRSAFGLKKFLGGSKSPSEAAAALLPPLNKALAGIATASLSPPADPAKWYSASEGFLNIKLADDYLMASSAASEAPFPQAPWLRVLIDYSSPNCAKRMHVGHLRSTVIGDALCRLMQACGADVERVNHLGDWGTPFGVIIEQALGEKLDLEALDLKSIEGVYQRGAARMALAEMPVPGDLADEPRAAAIRERSEAQAFAQKARETTAQMQRREQPAHGAWAAIRKSTVAQLQSMYDLMGIGMAPQDAIGESDYQDEAGPILQALVGSGICVSGPQGIAFLGGKNPLPLEKSASAGGGLLYGGTDVAALARRAKTGRKLLYVTDNRQAGHFAALFELGIEAGWIERGEAIHVPFGMMLDASGQPFKSRSGGAMPLDELVHDAVQMASDVTRSKAPHISDDELAALAAPIGIGALKYGDLSRNRTSAVKFDLGTAVALEGDTGPYLQYARVRALSASASAIKLPAAARSDSALDAYERKLAWALCRIKDAASEALQELSPHILCLAMFEAASAFGAFYENCPCDVGGQHDPVRLALMESFAARMGACLESLGIQSPSSMPRPQKRPAMGA